jgi:hypothetical protein
LLIALAVAALLMNAAHHRDQQRMWPPAEQTEH